jgi:amidase
MTAQRPKWEKVAASKRLWLAEQIPLEYRIPPSLFPPDDQLNVTTFPTKSGWFAERELEITRSSASRVLQKISSKTWSAEEVTRAFCKRAAAAQQLVRHPIRGDA